MRSDGTAQPGLWVCFCLLTETRGLTHHVDPAIFVTLAHSEGEAMGKFIAWLGGFSKNRAIMVPKAQRIRDDMVAAAAPVERITDA